MGDDSRGFAADRLVAWFGQGSRGRALHALGDPERAVRLVASLAKECQLAEVRRLHLPGGEPAGAT